MADRAGQRLGNYRLVHLLGHGGFADVYLGEHVHLKRYAALKVLHAQLDSASLEGFRREAQLIAQLEHPHIVRVLDFGIEDSFPFLVIEYAPGGTLRHRYPRGTKLPLKLLRSYIKQTAEALQYSHNEKFIHRDVKPENILVGRQGEILLSDFGIAVLSQSGRTSLQSPAGTAGTPFYMAPEQIQGKPSRASDQYALGIIAYEWICGFPPFTGGLFEIYAQHLHSSPSSFIRTRRCLKPEGFSQALEIEKIIMKALEKDPKKRFSSILDFATTLEEAINKNEANDSSLFRELFTIAIVGTKDKIEDFDPKTALDPSNAPIFRGRGRIYASLKQYDRAIDDYNQAITLDPDEPDGYKGRGDVYKQTGQHEQAKNDYEIALALENPLKS